jgi:glutamate synthase domain-containing protein 1
MCGIVGLLVKTEGLRPRLGELMVPMLAGMTERGPDSSGMAEFTNPVADGHRKLSLYCQSSDFDWKLLETRLKQLFGAVTLDVRVNHAVMTTTSSPPDVRTWLQANSPAVHVLSVGRAIDLYKDVGLPSDVAQRYDFARAAGTHLVGHTRMATESAVTPQNAHPYTAGEDWCLVHNGSLANPGMLRRKLESSAASSRRLRHRERVPLSALAAGAGRIARDGAPSRIRGFRRVLHVPHGYGRQARARTRPLCV